MSKKIDKQLKQSTKKNSSTKFFRYSTFFSILVSTFLIFVTISIIVIEKSDNGQEVIPANTNEIKNTLVATGKGKIQQLNALSGITVYADQEIMLVAVQPLVQGIGLSGTVLYKDDDSFLSISVIDQQNKQHLIFKGSATDSQQTKLILQKYCLHSCNFSRPIQPLKLRVKANNASLTIDSVDYISI